ncbi:MAG: C1 family peptidase [Lentisphaeria bacterium]|nr:C1 family peptidase [Lentisphaeria bacterium]
MSTAEPESAALTREHLDALEAAFGAHPTAERMQNAVTQTSIDKVALRHAVVRETDHTFSVHLDDWSVTNQKSSGRCWLFAGLNLLRVGPMKAMKLENFEFSQNYAMFWDKIERANFFLENVLATADREVDEREVHFLLSDPIGDGGQWNMFVNLVRKHGAVPKSAMPETESSSNTGRMNGILRELLRQAARELRGLGSTGHPPAALRRRKHEILTVVYRVLCIHLGSPPRRFLWQWKDKDKVFHRDGVLTPQEFAAKYITLPFREYVCLVHDPRPENPFGRTYTVKYLGNVVDGEPVVYLNVTMADMKRAALKALQAGEPVWMGCDVGKQMHGETGIWDAGLYDFAGIYDTVFALDKAARLHYHQTLMTHAMLFTGVDLVDGKPRRWRVENSWGDDKGRGQKGFYTMNDSWFDEYMFEIAAPRSRLPKRLQAALERPPRVLPPWDPMGALAR